MWMLLTIIIHQFNQSILIIKIIIFSRRIVPNLISVELKFVRSYASVSLTVASIAAHLSRARHIVVLSDIEFADGAGTAAFEQPSIDALAMEEVHTGHRSQLLSRFIFD